MGNREDLFVKKFGENLKKLRLKKDVTQEKLAFTIGIEISQISRIERGVVSTSITSAYKIANALELDVKQLFDFTLD